MSGYLNDMYTLTEDDYKAAAHSLGVRVEVIKAVAKVESNGLGFFPDGQAVILFEPHIFGKLTNYRYVVSHPHLSRRGWDRKAYGPTGQHQHNKLAQAVALNRDAALMSASWGQFQIMGFNWEACGYRSLQAFINDVTGSAAGQLRAFVGFVKKKGLHAELKSLNWAGFAYGYNGSGYAANKYDKKMKAEYDRLMANRKVTTDWEFPLTCTNDFVDK